MWVAFGDHFVFDDFFHCQLNKVKCTCTTSSQQIKLSESYVMQVRRGQIEKGEGARIIKKIMTKKKGVTLQSLVTPPTPGFEAFVRYGWIINQFTFVLQQLAVMFSNQKKGWVQMYEHAQFSNVWRMCIVASSNLKSLKYYPMWLSLLSLTVNCSFLINTCTNDQLIT